MQTYGNAERLVKGAFGLYESIEGLEEGRMFLLIPTSNSSSGDATVSA